MPAVPFKQSNLQAEKKCPLTKKTSPRFKTETLKHTLSKFMQQSFLKAKKAAQNVNCAAFFVNLHYLVFVLGNKKPPDVFTHQAVICVIIAQCTQYITIAISCQYQNGINSISIRYQISLI